MPVYQALIYPVLNHLDDTASQKEHYYAAPLGTPAVRWGIEQYASRSADRSNPAFAPLQTTDFTGLPPATVITAGIDPVRSEGEAYALRLRQAGVMVDHVHYPGLPHDFFGMGAVLDEAKEAVSRVAAGLKNAFGR